MTQIKTIPIDQKHANLTSPFRYPGGKAFMSSFLAKHVRAIGSNRVEYAEPYAGGAGAAVRLLALGEVSRIRINDADPRIYAAWDAMISETDRFLDCLSSCNVTISEWRHAHSIVSNPSTARDSFELGFATFFLNRTNRSGIILGAAPIGGYKQAGEWKMDARFNRDTLLRRISWLGENSNKIKITNKDGVAFLREQSRNLRANNTLFFIDPPYVAAGGRLYLNAMTVAKHRALALLLAKGRIQNFVLTYDDAPLIRELYSEDRRESIAATYSLQRKRREREIMIRSPFLSKIA